MSKPVRVTVTGAAPSSVNATTADRMSFVVVVLKVAVTGSAALIVTTQLPVPVQAPLQPANVEPEFATCVNVTCDPAVKFAAHVLGHKIPDGALVTVPVPAPASVTVSAKVVVWLNVAVTVSDADGILNVHVVPVPVHAVGVPLHPANVNPGCGISLNVTEVPAV